MTAVEKIAEKDDKQVVSLDKFLYNYSLSFSKALGEKAAIDELEAIKNDTLLYNYIYAIKGWKDMDTTKSNEYITKVIQQNGKLGYAIYINGINYYEEAVRKDFSKAESFYLKSLELLPNHAEGYFALAHCYKKWGQNLKALRAFRKTVDLMPFEDHRTDPYGITVHAIGEINALKEFDVKE
jgi:tetratricopeptide (TPR) repeat protein